MNVWLLKYLNIVYGNFMLNYIFLKDLYFFINILDVVCDIYRYVIWIMILFIGFDEWIDNINVYGRFSLLLNLVLN